MSGESIDTRRRRLRMRAWRRGTREMDLILGSFADARLDAMEPVELDVFEAVLAESDVDLYRWVAGHEAPPPHLATIIAALSNSARARRGAR